MNEAISVLFQRQPGMKKALLQRFLDALGYIFEPFRVYLIRNELLGNPLMIMGPSHDRECLVVLEVVKQ